MTSRHFILFFYLISFTYHYVNAESFESLGRVVGKRGHGNFAFGILKGSEVNVSAHAISGGKASSGGVLAVQNRNDQVLSTNIAVGILKNSQINAKAVASGHNSHAYAGGVIAISE